MDMSLFKWLADNNYGGFTVEVKRLERATDLAAPLKEMRMAGGPRICSVDLRISNYQVVWMASMVKSRNIARVTPSCTCARLAAVGRLDGKASVQAPAGPGAGHRHPDCHKAPETRSAR